MNKRGAKDVDLEVDLHGLTVEQMQITLQKHWPQWRGLHKVRIIHGQGEALKPEIERWANELGLPFAPDPGNPGALRIFPHQRTLPDAKLGTTLRDAGLMLTPEEQAYLRDPVAMERARQEEKRRQAERERRRQEDAAKLAARKRSEESLWQAEMARLDALDRRGGNGARQLGGGSDDHKPTAPRIVPKANIKHQEGYWRAELVRVADTPEETLKVEKRTGLDKLAPPMEAVPRDNAPVAPSQPPKPKTPPRDLAADQALFEAALADLDG